MTEISAIMTAHREGALAAVSLRSLLDAVAAAEAAGLSCEVLVMLDNADEATRRFVSGQAGVRLVEVSYADQGRVRNHAVQETSGRYVAFLDGDDLWSENWLVAAHAMCESDPGRVVAHPDLNWIFGNGCFRYHLPDQTDPYFADSSVRVVNPWDALCLAPREVYLDHPFSGRDIAGGFAFEDWHWNMETVAAGLVHRVCPGTIHFKRRRDGSQLMNARANRSMTRHSALLDYAWWRDRDESGTPG